METSTCVRYSLNVHREQVEHKGVSSTNSHITRLWWGKRTDKKCRWLLHARFLWWFGIYWKKVSCIAMSWKRTRLKTNRSLSPHVAFMIYRLLQGHYICMVIPCLQTGWRFRRLRTPVWVWNSKRKFKIKHTISSDSICIVWKKRVPIFLPSRHRLSIVCYIAWRGLLL